MKNRSKYFLMLLGLCLAFTFSGCVKVDTLPQLDIQVVDQNGTLISGASVALFANQEEWSKRDNPVQVWRTTGADGHVTFIDLEELSYYVYVRYDGKDNSLDEVKTTEPLQMNQRDQILVHIR